MNKIHNRTIASGSWQGNISSPEHKEHMWSCKDCWISVVCPSLTIDLSGNVWNDVASAHCQGYMPVSPTKGGNICYVIRRFNFLIGPNDVVVRWRNIYFRLLSGQTSFQTFLQKDQLVWFTFKPILLFVRIYVSKSLVQSGYKKLGPILMKLYRNN